MSCRNVGIKHPRNLDYLCVSLCVQANSDNVNSGVVQNAVALLGNLGGNSTLDLEPDLQKGTVCP